MRRVLCWVVSSLVAACGAGGERADAGAVVASASGAGGAIPAGGSGAGGILAAGGGGASAQPGYDARAPQASADAATGTRADAGDARDAAAAARDAGTIVALPGGASALFPAPNARDVCPDPPLRISFAAQPALGDSGQIEVFDAAAPASAVATLDMAVASTQQTIGGTAFNVPRRAFVDGNSAVLYVSPALARGKTYFVHVESGALVTPAGTPYVVEGDMTWRFTTSSAPPSNPAAIRVALDGSGEYCSVQGALDAVPDGNSAAVRIEIGAGSYFEIIHFRGKDNVTLHGDDRAQTIIAGTNNNSFNMSTATRALVGIDDSQGVVIENLTIHNLTPQGGSQAEALRMQKCDQCSVRHADILSLQDTLLWSGRIYADHCVIAGNVDFIWGTGAAYFNACEIKTVGRAGYNVQARNAAGAYGYVFVDSKLTSDPGVTGSVLARIDAGAYPGSHVAYIDCELGSHISAAGWLISGIASSALRFWEYRSTAPGGALIDTSQRAFGSSQLTADQAAMMRDPSVVLSGWTPN